MAHSTPVDLYQGGYVRASLSHGFASGSLVFTLATVAGTGGEPFTSTAQLRASHGPDDAWIDYAGTLGPIVLPGGDRVTGDTLAEWIDAAAEVQTVRDNTDPAHPSLVVTPPAQLPSPTTPRVPTRSDVVAYLGVGYVDPGAPLDQALAAAIEAQASRCVVEPYTASLHTAALRRTAAILAATNAPLGVTDLGDLGASASIPRWDAITETLESAYLRPRFA